MTDCNHQPGTNVKFDMTLAQEQFYGVVRAKCQRCGAVWQGVVGRMMI